MSVPRPSRPFEAHTEIIRSGEFAHRIHSSRFRPAEFNPGVGSPTRFAFFGSPPVSVLYAALRKDAALCESLLHDVPKAGGSIRPATYKGRQCSRLITRRDIRLASLVGLGERVFRIDAAAVSATDAAEYGETVLWAEAAYDADFEGLIYPSSKAGGRAAMVFFGDRIDESEFEVDGSYWWSFDEVAGFNRMVEVCASVNVTVMHP